MKSQRGVIEDKLDIQKFFNAYFLNPQILRKHPNIHWCDCMTLWQVGRMICGGGRHIQSVSSYFTLIFRGKRVRK